MRTRGKGQKSVNDDYLLIPRLLRQGETGDTDALKACFVCIKELEKDGANIILPRTPKEMTVTNFDQQNFDKAHRASEDLRTVIAKITEDCRDPEGMTRLYRDTLLFDAPYDLDCFCRFIEWNREPDKRFYMPRRKQLLPIVRALERLERREKRLLCISCPPGIGKTTIAEFFLTWTGGRNPHLPNIVGSHSNAFLRGMYDEIYRIVGKHSEYLWQPVFPEVKVTGSNAKDMMLDIGTRKRFPTFEFASLGSGNAGRIRAANLLYLDDLVDGIETAMSIDRLNKIYQQYYTDYRQRKIGDCVELHIATRWSVHDVIGRLEDAYGQNDDAEFIILPALDEHDESNFDYPYGVGFSTQFYREQREIMDAASWKALYMNEPIEREGQLYPADQLQRYFELPEGEPDAIIGVCDTKTTGSDYCSMPIAYQYGNKFYIEDVLFENYAPNVVEVNLVNKICEYNPHMIRFESNVAGGKLAADVQSAIRERNCRTKIETKWTQQNKETKILVEAPWVIEHCIFKDDSVLHGEEWREYRKFLQSLSSYSLEGKNKHDDAPDSMAQLSQYVQGFGGNKVQILRRMF